MPDEEYNIPDWMKERAGKIETAGGQTKYELSKEAQETLVIMSKMKPKTWKTIGETFVILGSLVEYGVFAGLKDIGQDFKETLLLQAKEALAPLSNEIDQALAEALAPIMPEIQDFLSEMGSVIGKGIGGWKAIFTGNFDVWLKEQTIKFQLGMAGWTDELKAFHLEIQKIRQAFEDRLKETFNNLRRGSIEELSNLPGLPTGVGTGFDIGQGIVNAWTGFWRDLGWK